MSGEAAPGQAARPADVLASLPRQWDAEADSTAHWGDVDPDERSAYANGLRDCASELRKVLAAQERPAPRYAGVNHCPHCSIHHAKAKPCDSEGCAGCDLWPARVPAGERPAPGPLPASMTQPADFDDTPELTEHVSVRFPADMIAVAKQLAAAEGMTVSAWIRREVERETGRRERPAPELGDVTPGQAFRDKLRERRIARGRCVDMRDYDALPQEDRDDLEEAARASTVTAWRLLDEARADRDDYAARLKAVDQSWAQVAAERDEAREQARLAREDRDQLKTRVLALAAELEGQALGDYGDDAYTETAGKLRGLLDVP